jgi:hypothetical protein
LRLRSWRLLARRTAGLEIRVVAREVVDGGERDDRWSRGRASRASCEGVRQKARQFGSEIKVIKGKREANAKSPIKLMTLGLRRTRR